MDNKLCVTIPYWEADPDKRRVLNDCIRSFKGYDNLIVLAGKQASFPLAVNMCLDLGFSTGATHVIVSNDDLTLEEGLLSDLCEENSVTSPLVNNNIYKIFHAHMFCIPRHIFEKVGRWDEQFLIYWADTDYAVRMKQAGIDVKIRSDVKVNHKEAGRTIKHYKGTTEVNDEEIFIKKWGRKYFDPIVDK